MRMIKMYLALALFILAGALFVYYTLHKELTSIIPYVEKDKTYLER